MAAPEVRVTASPALALRNFTPKRIEVWCADFPSLRNQSNRGRRVIRKDRADVLVTSGFGKDFGKNRSVVDSNDHSARPGEHWFFLQARPFAVYFSTVDAISDREEGEAATVVGSGGAVLVEPAAEFGHDDRGNTLPDRARVGVKRRQAAGEGVDRAGLRAAVVP